MKDMEILKSCLNGNHLDNNEMIRLGELSNLINIRLSAYFKNNKK